MLRPLVVALVLAWSLPARAYDLGRPMGLYPPGGAPALAMLDSRIEITVRGPILETVVVQRFRNAGARATEATYIFPLPADAAVSAMAMKIGTRTIRAAIEIREAAQRRYEAAIAAGVAGTLLEQERPDVFTQNVSAIPPGGVVEVTLRYDSVARYESGRWELVLPMVVAPRHVPGTASGRATTGSGRAPDTDRAPDASRVTPGGSPGAGGATAVAIHFIDPPSELASPTHELGGTRGDATLSDPHSDHDAIVRWRAPAPAAGWVERDGDAGFAAVVVEAPPPAARKGAVRVILAIDRAATTRGDGDAVEHPLIRALCGALDPADQVRVIGSNELAWNPPGEVLRALERAWATPAPVFDLTRVLERAHPDGAAIVLVSDGLVADDQAAIAAAQRLGGPVHVIGIGPAPARATLQQIAAAGGGTVRYAVAGDDVAALARAVVGDIAGPPAPLTINWGTLGASDIEPAVLPRLGAGQAMLALARIKRVQAANARTRGELFAFESLAAPRTVDGATTPRGPLARRWAHERLRDLLAAGRDRTTVVDHALRYGLVSPHTSLVAIGSDVVVSGGVKHSVAVPVSVPSGMNWRAVQQAIDPDTALEPGPAPGNAPVPPRPEPAPPAPEPQPARTTPPAKTAPPATKAPPTRGGPSGKHRPSPKAGAEGAEGDTRPRKNKKDSGGAASGDAVSDREGRKFDAKEGVANAPPAPAQAGPAADDDEEKPRRAEQRLATAAPPAETAEEMISLEGSTLRSSGRTLRLTAALGGGLAFDRGARGLGALDVRIETNRLTALGAEAALWLVGGTDPEGRVLLTVARGGLARRFELGFGAGLHFGNGTGIATSARLRVDTPLSALGGYLRYDTAVLLTRPSLAVEQALMLGLELSY